MVGLLDARAKADALRSERSRGVDPLATKRAVQAAAVEAAAKAVTFAIGFEEFLAQRGHELKGEHGKIWIASVRNHAMPTLGKLTISDITLDDVAKMLAPIWHTNYVTAQRVRQRVEVILDWAKVSGYRSGENPARLRGNVGVKLGKVDHEVIPMKALPYSDVPAFMEELRAVDSNAARALMFTVLTVPRTANARFARWVEIDEEQKLWIIPGNKREYGKGKQRMKTGVDHTIPLSDAALALLAEQRKVSTGDYIFPGRKKGRPFANNAMLDMLKITLKRNATVHGFRSSFTDWCRDLTKHDKDARRMSLAHKIGDAVEQSYARGEMLDKRRALMNDWAAFCDKVCPSAVEKAA